MDKLVLPGSFEWGADVGNLVALADVGRRGVDRSWSVKRASVFAPGPDIVSEPGTSVLHVIAMGASEDYGPNRNADGFKRAMLRRTHPTFVSDGHVYRSHVNDDPAKSSGSILKSAFNEDMKRVELLIRVKDAMWGEALNRLADGRDITVSMSIKVPHDVCSICGNKAARRADYCECMRKHAGRVLSDGRQVYVDNPEGTFFDISEIPGTDNQADRIAFGLSKVASSRAMTGAELFEELRGVPLVGHNFKSARAAGKKAVLAKLSAIEKEIEGVIESGSSDPLMSMCPAFSCEHCLDDGEAKELSGRFAKRLRDVVSQLGDVRVSLPFREFVRLVFPDHAGEADGDLLPGVFSSLRDDDDVVNDDAYDANPGRLFDALLPDEVRSLLSKFGLDGVGARARITVIRGGTVPKPRTLKVKVASAGSAMLAREYAKYKLALLERCAADPAALELGVLQNYC